MGKELATVKPAKALACVAMALVLAMAAVPFATTDTAYAASTKPAKVKNVTVSNVKKKSVKVSWSKANKAKKYKVAYKTSSSSSWKYTSVKAKKVTLKSLKSGTKYQVKVRAINGSKKGKWSATKTYFTVGNYSTYAKKVANLVNKERAAEGLDKLAYDATLGEYAVWKAEDMVDNGYLSHESPTYGYTYEVMQDNSCTFAAFGENIAMGQTAPASVMNAWMNSSGHKANILSASYDSIGVSAYFDGSRWWWVQVFASGFEGEFAAPTA